MAIMANSDRIVIWASLMREASNLKTSLPLLKTELKAAVDAADAWVDANSASYNTAIPLPARTALSTQQKAQILAYVISRRFELGL